MNFLGRSVANLSEHVKCFMFSIYIQIFLVYEFKLPIYNQKRTGYMMLCNFKKNLKRHFSELFVF